MQDLNFRLQNALHSILAETEERIEALIGSKVRCIISSNEKLNSIPITRIIQIVAEQFGLQQSQIIAKSRKHPLPDARHILFKLIKEHYPNLSLANIGHAVGHRDHTTVIHNIEAFNNLYQTDFEFKSKYNKCRDQAQLEIIEQLSKSNQE